MHDVCFNEGGLFMSKTTTYNGLLRKVWKLYKEEWCKQNGVPMGKRPQGFISANDFKRDLFSRSDFVKQYLTEDEFERYLVVIEYEKLLYVPIPIDWEKDSDEDIGKKMQSNNSNMERLDALAKKQQSLVGQLLIMPVPEHEKNCLAYYQICSECRGNKVGLRLCSNIGEDWDIPEWGVETKITREQALVELGNKVRYLIESAETDDK